MLIDKLSKRIDKIVIASGYCILVALLLSLSPGIFYQERLIREGVWQEYRDDLKNDKFVVFYALNTSDNKPSIRTPEGAELLALDGLQSKVGFDNLENQSFWYHTFRNVIEEGNTILRHNMIRENYQFLQKITLMDNAVVIEYMIKSATTENRSITLNLWHRYRETSVLKVDNVFVNDNRLGGEPTYEVWMQLDAKTPHSFRYENAPHWVNLIYSFENLAVGDVWPKDPLVKVTVSYSRLR